MRLVSCVLLALLFLSCAEQNKNTSIQDIVNQWIEIDHQLVTTGFSTHVECSDNAELAGLIEAVDVFCLSVRKFQESDLYNIYSAIPFSPQTGRRSLHMKTRQKRRLKELSTCLGRIFQKALFLSARLRRRLTHCTNLLLYGRDIHGFYSSLLRKYRSGGGLIA